MKSIKFIAFFLIFAFLISCNNRNEQSESETTNNNSKKLSVFTIKNLSHILKTSKNKIVIVNFWSTWCPECRKEIPDFIQFYDEFKDNVTLIGLALDENEDDVINFIKISKINYPIFLCSKSLAEHFMIQAIPVTYIFKNGKFLFSHLGAYSYSQLKSDILALLK